nr:hypothetical protein [Vibrio cholerae]
MWLIFISFFSVLKYSPENIHSDIILNTIMSIQNITLFYWEQNRLINLLPFLVSFIHDPKINIYAVLFLSSISFFSVIYLLSYVAYNLNCSERRCKNSSILILFISSSIFSTILISNEYLPSFIIGHIEHSLSIFMLGVAFILLTQFKLKFRLNVSLGLLLIILSLGLNPSIIIPIFFLIFSYSIYQKRISKANFITLIFCLVVFAVWSVVSSQYEGNSYNTFVFFDFRESMKKAFWNITGILNVANVFIVIFIYAVFNIILKFSNKENEKGSSENIFVINFILVFISLWIFIFSSNQWVQLNAFNVRYFTFVIFSFIFIFILFISNKLKLSLFLSIVMFMVSLYSEPFKILPIRKYNVFQKVENIVGDKSYEFYAGDYWLVWPSVLRELMTGREAYGITVRGEANRENIKNHIREHYSNREFTIFCLDQKTDACMNYIQNVLGDFNVLDVKKNVNGTFIIKLTLSDS